MVNKYLGRILAYGFVVALLISCASARVVSVEPGEGGVIALVPGQLQGMEEARGKAMVLMQSNCGSKKPKVTKEGEEVIGSDSAGSTHASKGGWSSSNSSSTRNATEWRLIYKCI